MAENASGTVSVGPKNIRGHYTVAIEFKPNEEAEKERKLIIVNDSITKGGLSPYDAYVNAGYDNPTELIARKLAYDLLQEPMIKRAIAKRLLLKWGEDADQLEMEEKMSDGQKQFDLKRFMDSLQLGTMTGVGDPMNPGNPPQPMNPPEAPPQGAGMALPAGAPPVQGMEQLTPTIQDINSLGRMG